MNLSKNIRPPIAEGIWLSDTNETYENSGYIPAVITSCGGKYKVGDLLESAIIMDYDTNNHPIIVKDCYKIIGVLKDIARIALYVVSNWNPKDCRDIYSVFNNDFEENYWLLTKTSDSYSCYGSYGPLYGAQFVFCNDMTENQIDEISLNLKAQDLPFISLDDANNNSSKYVYEQMYTLFPIAACIFILTIISTVSISAIYTKRQLRNYAIFYICGARWRTCALKSLKNGVITCAVSTALSALILVIGNATILKETVISFGLWHLAVCAGVIVLYLALSMIMPLSIIGSSQPREVLKEE